ncbi:hypothetical protein F4W70_28840, partial [Pseudomonas cannabina]
MLSLKHEPPLAHFHNIFVFLRGYIETVAKGSAPEKREKSTMERCRPKSFINCLRFCVNNADSRVKGRRTGSSGLPDERSAGAKPSPLMRLERPQPMQGRLMGALPVSFPPRRKADLGSPEGQSPYGPREGLKKPFLQKSKPVNTGAPARFLSKKMGFFRGYLEGVDKI